MSMTGPQNAAQFWRSIGRDVERLKLRVGQAYRPPSGATINRPDPSRMWPGQFYFDTDLNKPLFSTGTSWVDSAGTVVP